MEQQIEYNKNRLQEDFEDFFESALCGFITANAKGVIIRANKMVASWTGFESEQLAGKKFSELLSIGSRIYYETHLSPLLKMQGFFDEVVVELAVAGGKKLRVLVNAIENKINSNHPGFIRFVLLKATDRLQYEKNLKDANAEMNKRLLVQNALLEKQNEELNSFTYVASHDLKEPLRKIEMFISRIEQTQLDELSDKSKEYFEGITRASKRMQSLIDAILAYAQLEILDYLKPTDLNESLRMAMETLNEVIRAKNADIQFLHLPTIPAIPEQMEQLFTNLLSNALKYSKTDETCNITITAERVKDEREGTGNESSNYLWKINVADNGIGFDEIQKDKVFQFFQRLHSKTQYAGTGVGLAICKKIVENHQGWISVTSQIGRGATFSVFLPESHEPA